MKPRTGVLRIVAAIVATMVLSLAPGASPATVQALTFTPGCTVGELKTAINSANNSAGPDTIALPVSCVYTLETVDNEEFGGDNGLPIITEELIIEGNGSVIRRSLDNGTPPFRVLRSTAGTLTVRNISVQNGLLSGDTVVGAGIRTSAGLVVEYSVISGNALFADVDAQGGGTFSSGTTEVVSTLYSGNSASSTIGIALGGGAFGFGGLSTEDSSFIGNTVSSGNTALGGGAGSMGNATIRGSLFELNSVTASGAGASGGGVYSELAMTVEDSEFRLNTATATGTGDNQGLALGAGTRTQSTLSVTNSTYSGNTATGAKNAQGGGSYSFQGTEVSRSTYSDNTATSDIGPGEGGGVYAIGTMSLTNSTISGNTASGPGPVSSGGGAFSVLTMTLNNTTITGNTASGSVSPRGGGALVVSSNLVMNNSINALNTNGDCSALTGVTASFRNIDSDGSCDDATTANPDLLPLALNAPGDTATHALEPTSNARDLGESCEPTDQRGVIRPEPCDVGAYQFTSLAVDVNCDGTEDALDALTILRALAGLVGEPTVDPPCDADLNNDQVVDILDVHFAREFLAGLLN